MLLRGIDQDRLTVLLHLISNGDLSSFTELHRLSGRRLVAYALRIVKRHELAEDVVQESLIAVWARAHQFDPHRGCPAAWMLGIVRNKAIDQFRAHQTKVEALSAGEDVHNLDYEEVSDGPCDLVLGRERSRLIDAGLGALRPAQRQAIELAFIDECTHPEVAREMTVPLGTAKTLIRRGCMQLRGHLQGKMESRTSAQARC